MATEQRIDVNAGRDFDVRVHGLVGLDAVYTFYYDETNNVRKLYIDEDGLNVPELRCFVLGGIVHAGGPRDLDFPTLRRALRLQPTTLDMKLEHVAKGDFLEVLGKPKMTTYLQWVSDRGLLVHYFALDPLYWSSVDIIDSILATEPRLYAMHIQLKDDLYHLFRMDLDATVDFMRRYDYPNVGRARRGEFIRELLDWLEAFEDMFPHFRYHTLKGVLQMGRNVEALAFLEDEEPNVLIAEFSDFYINRFCKFKNSEHIADSEPRIRDAIEPITFMDGDRPIRNFRFVTSHDEPGVQISDVMVGLLGKMFTYLTEMPAGDIENQVAVLTDTQRQNLDLLSKLLDRSTDINAAFAHFVISAEDRKRAAVLLED